MSILSCIILRYFVRSISVQQMLSLCILQGMNFNEVLVCVFFTRKVSYSHACRLWTSVLSQWCSQSGALGWVVHYLEG